MLAVSDVNTAAQNAVVAAEALFGADPRLLSQSLASLEKDERGNLTAVQTRDGTRLACELLIAATGFAGCREDVCAAELDRFLMGYTNLQ